MKSTLQDIDRHWVGKPLFKNSSGVRGNLVGNARMALSKFRTGYKHVDDGEELAKSLRRRQYVELGNPFDSDVVDTIARKFDEHVNDDDRTYVIDYEGDEYSRQLRSWSSDDTPAFDFGSELPEINNLFPEKIRDIVRGYYGSYFKPDYVQLYRNYHVPDEVVRKTEIFSNYWHCDGRPSDFLKLFVNLCDVSESHGPFHVISRSDTKNIIGLNYQRDSHGIANEFIKEKADIVKAVGDAGYSMLANTNMVLHRAGNPAPNNHRDLLVVQLMPATSPLAEDWLGDPAVGLDRG